MKKVTFTIFVGFLFLVLVASNVQAEKRVCADKMGNAMHAEHMPMMGARGHGGMGMAGPGPHVRQALENLGLNEKQTDAIRAIGSRVAKENVKKIADLKVAGLDLRDVLRKDPVDMKAVEAKMRQMEALRTDIRLSRIGALEDIKAQLSPEQRKKFKGELGKQQLCECRDRRVIRPESRGKGLRPPTERKPR